MVEFVTNSGLDNITAAWVNYSSRARWLQWGEGSGQTVASNDLADKGDTTELRTQGSTSQETETVSNDTYQVSGSITADGTRAITELGVFDEAGTGGPPSGGNMGLYGDFAVINVSEDDSITFTVEVTLSDGS